jgi:hypothetical protein
VTNLPTDGVTLKTCPFCGGLAKLNGFMFNVWTVDCESCEIGTRPNYFHHDPKSKAIHEWNRRVS